MSDVMEKILLYNSIGSNFYENVIVWDFVLQNLCNVVYFEIDNLVYKIE